VKDGQVVKGIQFKNHEIVGDIIDLASRYNYEGADELVFYDITASPDRRSVDRKWINLVAKEINIPFCVAGGIKTIADAEEVLNHGADKISINTPALKNPDLIEQLAKRFGSQCIVVGIDSFATNKDYKVHFYTGDPDQSKESNKTTNSWINEVQDRGAGEIVLNCMNQDGVRKGYDIDQLREMRNLCKVPLIASGGAGKMSDFYDVFNQADVSGSLAASVFHKKIIDILDLKKYLQQKQIEVRL